MHFIVSNSDKSVPTSQKRKVLKIIIIFVNRTAYICCIDIVESSDTTHPSRSGQRDETNDDAFVALLTSHQGAIHAFLNSLLPGDPCVEDVLQRSNLVLWKKRDNFEPGTNFKAWAFSIARWETRAWLTTQKRQDWLVFNDELTDSIAEQLQELPDTEDSMMIRSLRLCLAKLNDKQRSLVLNYYQHDKSIGECATLVKRSEGSLRVSLFRIRTGLRRCIESQMAMKEVKS